MKLIGGLQAGTYRIIGHVDNINTCMKYCCESDECTVAYVDKGTCYTMKCLDRDLCKATISDSHSSVGYVIRDGWSLFKSAQDAVTDVIFKSPGGNHMVPVSNGSAVTGTSNKIDHGTILHGIASTPTQHSNAASKSVNATKPIRPDIPGSGPILPTIAVPQSSQGFDIGYCEKEETLQNQRLMGGMKAGVFRDHGEVADIGTCTEYCCRDKDCHLAYMVDRSCYSVKCYNTELCTTFKAPNFFLNPVIAFVNRNRNSSGKFFILLIFEI